MTMTLRSRWPCLVLLLCVAFAAASLTAQLQTLEHGDNQKIKRSSDACSEPPTVQYLRDGPYKNYFYSDCHSANQVIVTSPLPDSDLTLIGPRLLVAWPAGNSGVVAFFAPKNGKNGTLAIELVKDAGTASPLDSTYVPANSSSLTGNPRVGVTSLIRFNSSATMVLPILGSIRNIRDFTEGGSILAPVIQRAIRFNAINGGGACISRLWLDNSTLTRLVFRPTGDAQDVKISGRTLQFGAGTYRFSANFDYPQLTQLTSSEVLNKQSQGLITSDPARTKSLSFLSYTEKLQAGAWRFLTYFGRDSMISLLLMQPILSEGKGGAIEAVISAVLERIDRKTGTVCHEETIGDYATYLNLQDGRTSTAPSCNYIMVDTDYYLPIVMRNYFLDTSTGRARRAAFFQRKATLDFSGKGQTYAALAERSAERIMAHAAAFAAPGGQTRANLRHLEPGEVVGEWRDSTYGIGGGRTPFDVNAALVPAALRAIAALSAAGFFPSHPAWPARAARYAATWEDETLDLFRVSVAPATARELVAAYASRSGFAGPSRAGLLRDADGPLTYHALALDGAAEPALPKVRVLNSDTAFRLYLVNGTRDAQLTELLNGTARALTLPFPAGLSTDVGMLVANPAYGRRAVYAANFTRSDYHGTVVWGWQMAMMAKGLERQLGRCVEPVPSQRPAFCRDATVHSNVKKAYNHLWDLIERNTQYLSGEVWSWTYRDGKFDFTSLGELSATESNIRQLWSLTFLAVTRNDNFR